MKKRTYVQTLLIQKKMTATSVLCSDTAHVRLAVHVKGAAANATYLSPNIQNQMLIAAADLVRKKIIHLVREAGCWALIADETMDRQKREQLVIVIRYIRSVDNAPKHCEDPVAMLDLIDDIAADGDCHDEIQLSGRSIGRSVLKLLEKLGLDLSRCVAQCYDGASDG